MNQDSGTTQAADRIYHGLNEPDESDGRPIVVEVGGGGPTERKQARRLYKLTNTSGSYGPYSFWWGYRGSNPHDAAEAILTDALDEPPTKNLRRAFVEDIVAHLPEEGEW